MSPPAACLPSPSLHQPKYHSHHYLPAIQRSADGPKPPKQPPNLSQPNKQPGCHPKPQHHNIHTIRYNSKTSSGINPRPLINHQRPLNPDPGIPALTSLDQHHIRLLINKRIHQLHPLRLQLILRQSRHQLHKPKRPVHQKNRPRSFRTRAA